jgi:hypothetical protein
LNIQIHFFQKKLKKSKINILGKLGEVLEQAFDDCDFLEVIFLLDLRWGRY